MQHIPVKCAHVQPCARSPPSGAFVLLSSLLWYQNLAKHLRRCTIARRRFILSEYLRINVISDNCRENMNVSVDVLARMHQRIVRVQRMILTVRILHIEYSWLALLISDHYTECSETTSLSDLEYNWKPTSTCTGGVSLPVDVTDIPCPIECEEGALTLVARLK